jgi:SAM-dependent methyltransferase
VDRFGGYDDNELLAEFYDYVPGYADRADRDFHISYSKSAGGKTLELGCGTGRILIPTAEAGCEIVGLDISRHMLARCREKLARASEEVDERVQLVQGSATDFKLNETFALITTPFRVFQHLISVEEQLACLRRANRHLEINGRLILDLFQVNLEYLMSPDRENEREDFPDIELSDGRKIRRTHRVPAVHFAKQYSEAELIYHVTHPDGRQERAIQAFPFRYFFRYEVEHLLYRCGFDVEDVFGDFDRSALIDGSPEMIFVAQKSRNV